MKPDDLKKIFGAEYPDAVFVKGIRLPLRRQRRFSRSYHSDEHEMGSEVSRFMDGSASITALELQAEWPAWTADQRMDFCESCSWLSSQADFPDMLRFIMTQGAPEDWSGIALSVGAKLPRDEAFDLLLRALGRMSIGRASNIGQAIALTKHPNAAPTLRRHLETVWAHSGLWDDTEFTNWVAFDATTCIAHLIELGVAPADFEAPVRQLVKHPCAGNRRSCRNFLSKHYSWLL
jgi:hypothetical protein